MFQNWCLPKNIFLLKATKIHRSPNYS